MALQDEKKLVIVGSTMPSPTVYRFASLFVGKSPRFPLVTYLTLHELVRLCRTNKELCSYIQTLLKLIAQQWSPAWTPQDLFLHLTCDVCGTVEPSFDPKVRGAESCLFR